VSTSSKGIEKLKTVLPANHKAMQKATKAGDIPNISTEPCAETPAFNSEALSAAFQAQSAMNAEHLNLAAHALPQGPQDLRQLRTDLSETTTQLRELRLPDTRVNIDGIKMEIPFEIKQYAIDIDQEKYMKIMWGLLGKERVLEFRKHATKSNQNNTPALWLNQHICIETKKPYVFMLHRDFSEQIKEKGLDNIAVELQQQASDYLEMALGSTLRSSLNQIAQSNQLPLFVVFVIIVDAILKSKTVIDVPMTPSSLWENPFREEG
jgi:hypothetical protein